MDFKTGFCTAILITALSFDAVAQSSQRWQQHVSYKMKVSLNVHTNRFKGTQQLIYTNNSPDTLYRVFYHLYLNAFQPGSMMDVRSRTIVDPDPRIDDRIQHLKPDQVGYEHIHNLKQDGTPLDYTVHGTILEVNLAHPIMPHTKTVFHMTFTGQVPLQIRRTGRDNKEGVRYSMTQWYPKMAEYDYQGWHADPYIEREFYGVWGDFDVRITIDSSYTLGGTGYLMNPQQVGHGYQDPSKPLAKPDTSVLTWHFYAPEVHDFAWAADPKYTHEKYQVPNGPTVHLLYIKGPHTKNWATFGPYVVKAIEYYDKLYGKYPYKQFSVIQGGDGGMEYPMCTLMTGWRSVGSLVGTMAHELAHQWFYGMMGSNETYYAWMDEGFATYASTYAMQKLFNGKGFALGGSYSNYLFLHQQGLEEPMITPADHYRTNTAYDLASYSKGSMFLEQLGYIIGQQNLQETFKRYYDMWKYRHPNPNDFIRVAEKVSGLELDWYRQYWINSTKTIDYAIDHVKTVGDSVKITLRNRGSMMMPLDVLVTYNDGSQEFYYIPLRIMLGDKPNEFPFIPREILPDWPWVNPTYSFTIAKYRGVRRIDIDPTLRMADIDRLNNTWPFPVNISFIKPPDQSWTQYEVTWRPAIWYGQKSGIRLGAVSQGSYLFGNNHMKTSLFLTSGDLQNYQANKTDVDYNFSYQDKAPFLGFNALWNVDLKRYYGVFQEQIGIRKELNRYGVISPIHQYLTLDLFHQAKTADRMVGLFQPWQRGSTLGLRAIYTYSDNKDNNVTLALQSASFNGKYGANFLHLNIGKLFHPSKQIQTRLSFDVFSGSRSLPMQYRQPVSRPSLDELWQDPAFTAVYNIDSWLGRSAHLLPSSGNALMGYALNDIGSPDQPGNNAFSVSVWNTWTPFMNSKDKLRWLSLELFGGIGKSWNNGFFNNFPTLFGNNISKSLLASFGGGIKYDIGDIRSLKKWTAQSSLLQNLSISLRVPVYLKDLQNHNDWGPRFVVGISKSL